MTDLGPDHTTDKGQLYEEGRKWHARALCAEKINAELLTLLRRVLSVGLDEGAGYLKQEKLADDLTQEIRAAIAKAKS